MNRHMTKQNLPKIEANYRTKRNKYAKICSKDWMSTCKMRSQGHKS